MEIRIGNRYKTLMSTTGLLEKTTKQTEWKTGTCIWIHPTNRWILLDFGGWRECRFVDEVK